MRRLATFSKFIAFSRAERRLLLASAFLLPLLAASVRVFGLARVMGWLACQPAETRQSDTEAPALAALVDAAAHHLPMACSCLTRSLLLDWMLRRRGFASELRIGVRLVGGNLQAHAWVQLDGTPLNDAPVAAGRFAAFDGRVPRRLLPRL